MSYHPFLGNSLIQGMQTVSAIYSHFLAMLLHPDAMRKAQQELDAVVGNDRLPSFADRDYLPYTHALSLEVLRWHTAGPLGNRASWLMTSCAEDLEIGMPHSVVKDDIHNGYRIPKGALV